MGARLKGEGANTEKKITFLVKSSDLTTIRSLVKFLKKNPTNGGGGAVYAYVYTMYITYTSSLITLQKEDDHNKVWRQEDTHG